MNTKLPQASETVASMSVFQFKTPLKAVQETTIPAPTVWYVYDAEGNKLAIANKEVASAFVEAVNYAKDLEENQSQLLEKNDELRTALMGLLAVINEMELGVKGQEAEWRDCKASANEVLNQGWQS